MTALMEAVAAVTAGVPRVKPLNEPTVKGPDGKTRYPYSVFSAVLGRGAAYTTDSRHGMRHGRVVVQTFGKTTASALDHMDKVVVALLDKRLTDDTTPLRIELDPAVVRDPDDSGVVGVTATFAFTQEATHV